MDLNEIEVPETATIHVEHPKLGRLYDDEERQLPCEIDVFGPASDRAVEVRREASKRMTERLGRKGVKALSSMPPEELEEMEVTRLARMTAAVRHLRIGGTELTPENIEMVYRDPRYGWLREQVAEKLGGWEDFLS